MKLEALKESSFDDIEIVNKRSSDILELLKSRIVQIKLTYPNIIFQMSGCEPYVEIYIVGNKIIGSKYDLETWKSVPLYKSICTRSQVTHQYYLDMRINFSGSNGSEDWRLSKESLTKKIDKALLNAINDFTMQESNTL